MPNRSNNPYKTWEIGAIALAFAGFAFVLSSLTVFKMSNNDIWIHLKTGENILETWEVPNKDPYSFTASDHDYVAHEWLAGVLFHLVYRMAGVNGLIFFRAAIIFATCAALFGACYFRRDRLVVLFPCFTLMAFIGSARFLSRPHIFSYLFVALYLLCYFAYKEGGRNRIWLYAVPFLHILWTNLHGGHYQGIFLLVMLAAAEVIMYVRAERFRLAIDTAIPFRDVLLVCALPFVSLLAGLINPYGLRLLTFPFELTEMEVFMKGIYEWQPAVYRSYNPSAMFLYYVWWVIALFGSFLAVRGHSELRRTAREAASALNYLLTFLWLIFALQFFAVYKSTSPPALLKYVWFWYAAVALFLIANAHRLEFHHAGIVALFFAMSMRHNRAVTDAAIGTLPSLSHNLNELLDRFKRPGRQPIPWLKAASLAAMGLAMIGLGLFTYYDSYYFSFDPSTKRDMGLGIARNMPVGAVRYITKNHITGNAFTAYNSGALLIHQMWPDVKVAMDSRNDVYGEALYREYRNTLLGGDALDTYLRKWPVDFFLVGHRTDPSGRMFEYLDESPEWVLVYFDDLYVVYVKNIPRFHDLIRRDGLNLIRPSKSGTLRIPREQAHQWLEEAERAAASAPDSWFPLQYKVKALMTLERYDDAELTVRKLLEIYPKAYFAWADLGILLQRRGQDQLAAEALTRCAELEPNFPACRNYARGRRGR